MEPEDVGQKPFKAAISQRGADGNGVEVRKEEDEEESVDGSDIADEEDYQNALAYMLANGEDKAAAKRQAQLIAPLFVL